MISCPAFRPGKIAEVLGQRLAGDGQAVAVEQSLFQQVLHHGRRAADVVQIFHHVFAARLQIGHDRECGR